MRPIYKKMYEVLVIGHANIDVGLEGSSGSQRERCLCRDKEYSDKTSRHMLLWDDCTRTSFRINFNRADEKHCAKRTSP